MAATKPYDEDLRAIGQALEARNISVFELKRLADRYVIEVRLRRPARYVRRYDSGTCNCAAVPLLSH
jgi:hypothetical protein